MRSRIDPSRAATTTAGRPPRHGWAPTAVRVALAAVLARGAPAGAQAPLTVGLPDDETVALEATGPAFVGRIPLTTDSLAVQVRVPPTSLFGGDGAPVPLTLRIDGADRGDDGAWTVPANALVHLVLEATLPRPGAYEGGFSLRAGPATVRRGLAVRWRPRGPPLLSGPGGLVAGTLEGRGGGAAELPITLIDTTGTAPALRVTVDSVRRWIEEGVAAAVALDSVRIRTAGPPPDGRSGEADPAAPPGTIGVAGRTPAVLEVFGLPGAGRYEAVVRAEAQGMSAVSQAVVIALRRPAWLAVLLIGLGIVVAESLRHVNQKLEPRLARLAAVARVGESLEAERRRLQAEPLAGDEREVFDLVARRIASLYGRVDRDAAPSYDEELADLRDRIDLLPGWVDLGREARAADDRTLREELLDVLEPVEAYLRLARTATEAEREAARTALEGAPEAMREAFGEWLRDLIAEMKQSVTERYGEEGPGEAIVEELDAAGKALDEGRRTEARETLRRVRRALADAVERDIRTTVEAGRPTWFEDTAWTSIVDDVERMLAEEPSGLGRREQVVEAAQRTLIEGSVDALAAAVERARQGSHPVGVPPSPPAGPQPSPPAGAQPSPPTAAQSSALAAVADHLTTARVHLSLGRLGAAAAALTEAASDWSDYEKASRPARKGPMEQGLRPFAIGGADLPAALDLDRGPPQRTGPAPAPSAGLERRRHLVTLLAKGLVALLALWFGADLLWAPDLTWGGTGDYLVALAWGLGIQNLGNEAFVGIGEALAKWKPAA